MNELRCDRCRWWTPPPSRLEFGTCQRLADSSGLTHGSKAVAVTDGGMFAILKTEADFGCVQWEEKK
jgi:hypothetical protein